MSESTAETLFGALESEQGDEGRRRSQWELRTKHGYEFDEVASALQKCIRRAWEDEALWWAMELNESGYGAYCWRRLMVIASEDIGMADPQAIVVCSALHYASIVIRESGAYKKANAKGMPWPEENLLQAVMYLARAPKNRECNDAYLALKLRMERGERLAIPEVALDRHTKRGRKLGRDWAYFETEGTKTEPLVRINGDPWHERWTRESRIADGGFKGFKE